MIRGFSSHIRDPACFHTVYRTYYIQPDDWTSISLCLCQFARNKLARPKVHDDDCGVGTAQSGNPNESSRLPLPTPTTSIAIVSMYLLVDMLLEFLLFTITHLLVWGTKSSSQDLCILRLQSTSRQKRGEFVRLLASNSLWLRKDAAWVLPITYARLHRHSGRFLAYPSWGSLR